MAATQEKKQSAQPPGLGVRFLRDGAERAQALNQQPDSIPAMMKPGEFVLPPDTVHAVGGVHFLKKMVDATHTPMPSGAAVSRGVPPEFRPEMFFANGGLVDDEATRPNSFGDAAAAASSPGVKQVGASPGAGAAEAKLPQEQGSPFLSTPGARAGLTQGQQPATPRPEMPGTAPATAASAPSVSPSGLYMQDRAQEMKDQWGKGNYAQAAGTAARTAVQGLGMYGVEAADKVVSPWVDATKSFGRGLIGADSSAGTVSGAPSAPYAGGAGAGRGSVNPPMADPAKPAPTVASTLQGWDRGNMTNAQVAQANPQGVVTARRGASGTMEFSGNNVSGPVSYADAGGKPMDGRGIEGRGWGGFGVAPAGVNVVTGPNGSYAFPVTPSNLSGSPSNLQATGKDPMLNQHPIDGAQLLAASGFRIQEPGGVGFLRSPQGATGGSNDAPGLGVRPALAPANAEPAPGLGVWPALRGAQSTNDPNAGGSYDWIKDLRDPRTLAMRNAGVGSTIFRNQAEAMMAGKAKQANIAGARGAVAGQMHDAQQADTARYQSDNSLAGNLGSEQMRQEGETARAAMRSAVDRIRAGIEGAKAGQEMTARGFDIQAAEQMQQIRRTMLDPNSSPEQRQRAQQAWQSFTGKGDQNLSHNFVKRKVPMFNAKGVQLGEREEIVDLRTGNALGQAGHGGATTVSSPEQLAALPSGSIYTGPDGKQYRKN